MVDFLENEAERFSNIIHHGVGRFQILSTLQDRFVQELISYNDIESKKKFLVHLDTKIEELFSLHISTCSENSCSQKKTYNNIKFLMSSEMKNLMPKGNVSSLLENNQSYFNLVENYKKKIVTTSAFLEKEEFVHQEITRIRTIFIDKKVTILASSGRIISQFDFSKYVKSAYKWLMAGHDWSIEQIVKNARRDYDQAGMVGMNDQMFSDAIVDNLRDGVGFVLYEKFLKDQLKETAQLQKDNLHGKGNSSRKRRVSVPNKTKALLQKEIRSQCPFCFSEDVDHFEIHHIDENPQNNSIENLIMLCPLCHSKITKRDISREVVVNKKVSLQNIG